MEAEPELLTLDMVRKLINQGLAQQKAENAKQLEKQLAQQKAHYEDLLNKQADTFTKLVRVMMDSTNDRFDSAVNISHELKTSLHFTQNEVDELKKTIKMRKNPHTNFMLPWYSLLQLVTFRAVAHPQTFRRA